MNHLFKVFFGVTALAALLVLCVYSGCADIPDDRMPDDPVDTVVVVDTAFYGDTLVVCSTIVVGAGAASVRCDTTVLGGLSVPYVVSRIDERVNGYCLFPIMFTAFPRAEDLWLIDSIYIELGPDSGERIRLSPPAYSAEFTYADTGTHTARLLVAVKGVGIVLEDKFQVRTAMKAEVEPVNIPVSDVGVEYAIRVNGIRHSDAWWVWDLTNIGNDIVRTREDSVLVFVDAEYDTVVYLYQEDAFGNRTPATAVRFVSVYTEHRVEVSVVGGDAEVLPERLFFVPHAGEASISVSASRNIKIERIWLNGVSRFDFSGRVVADTTILFENIRSDMVILVAVAKIDTVMPLLTVNWPVQDTAYVPMCVAGALSYRLNKKMASGYIKWASINDKGWPDESTAVTVVMPDNLIQIPHVVGNEFVYYSPSEYLNEGVQKFYNLESMPQIVNFPIIAGVSYRLEVQFSDSLGNKSNTVVKVRRVRSNDQRCQNMYKDWLGVK